MKLSRQTSAIGTSKTKQPPTNDPLLPHESDQTSGSQEEREPRAVGKQAHSDIEQGIEDTDLRGGRDYQERTQNDTHANVNSKKKRKG